MKFEPGKISLCMLKIGCTYGSDGIIPTLFNNNKVFVHTLYSFKKFLPDYYRVWELHTLLLLLYLSCVSSHALVTHSTPKLFTTKIEVG